MSPEGNQAAASLVFKQTQSTLSIYITSASPEARTGPLIYNSPAVPTGQGCNVFGSKI